MERSPIGFKPELYKPIEANTLEKRIEGSPIELQARIWETVTRRSKFNY